MQTTSAHTQKQRIRAVNLCAILGWSGIALPLAIGISQGAIATFFGVLAFAAVIGLPIAFVIVWAVVAPILRWIMKEPLTWPRAASWGIVISGAPAWGFSSLIAGNLSQAAVFALFFMSLGLAISLAVRFIVGPGQKAEDR